MKQPISSIFCRAILPSLSLGSSIAATVNIAYVPVGNAGNATGSTGYGAVAYNYRIAKNETTVGQYVEFLNAKAKTDPYALYSTNMASDATIAGISRNGSPGSYSYSVIGNSANKPITYVSWFDAARFCNWLQNGQGSSSTETEAYTLNGAMGGSFTRNAGATTWVPNENEWYKAAYYDPTKGGSGGYWAYPTQSNALAGNSIGMANSANYFDGNYASDPGRLTDVGAYGANSDSFYGTNDQAGNAWEWVDGVIIPGWSRLLRGGSWKDTATYEASTFRLYGVTAAEVEAGGYGFRVASVPEASCLALALLAGGVFATRRKR